MLKYADICATLIVDLVLTYTTIYVAIYVRIYISIYMLCYTLRYDMHYAVTEYVCKVLVQSQPSVVPVRFNRFLWSTAVPRWVQSQGWTGTSGGSGDFPSGQTIAGKAGGRSFFNLRK